MARLESEAESARSMKEAKYEQFALGEYINHSTPTDDSATGEKGQTPQMVRSLTSEWHCLSQAQTDPDARE